MYSSHIKDYTKNPTSLYNTFHRDRQKVIQKVLIAILVFTGMLAQAASPSKLEVSKTVSSSCSFYKSHPIKLTKDSKAFKASVDISEGPCQEAYITLKIYDDKHSLLFSDPSPMSFVFYHDPFPGENLVERARKEADQMLKLALDTWQMTYEPENIVEEDCGFGLYISKDEYKNLAKSQPWVFAVSGPSAYSYNAYLPKEGKIVNYGYNGC